MGNMGDAYAEIADCGPFPAGDYHAIVKKATRKTSKTGNDYLALELEVNNGVRKEYVFDNLNIWHPNPRVAMFAKNTLRELSNAALGEGVAAQDTDDFVGKKVCVTLTLETQIGYGEQNRAVGYKHLSADVMELLNKRKRELLAGQASAAATPPAPAYTPPAAGVPLPQQNENAFDDDIPF